jgi:hypothetical protein
MRLSLMINMMIPLATHFCSVKPTSNIKDLLLRIYDIVLDRFTNNVDIYNKLYETAYTNTKQSSIVHKVLWDMQKIRGINVTNHTANAVDNILLQIVPKYVYKDNIIPYNYTAIQMNIGFQVTRIQYEYDFVPFSSSVRDEDGNSEFDKFESHIIKKDEAYYLQNTACYEDAMRYITSNYVNPSIFEINFYIRELSNGSPTMTINKFQKDLIFSFFGKFFGDITPTMCINQLNYVVLIINMKNILKSFRMKMLQYIVSSRVEKLVDKSNINKKELIKIKESNTYEAIVKKYGNNTKILKQIESNIATILNSDFRAIDFYDSKVNGTKVIINNMIIEEYLRCVCLF